MDEARLRRNADRAYARLVKPALDRVGAAVLLVAIAPVLGLVAAAVRVSLGSPVLYRQQRLGRGQRPFALLKFRTMSPDRRVANLPFEGRERRVSYEAIDDHRHTPLGEFLRRWSLDELPQLWNVLRGEM